MTSGICRLVTTGTLLSVTEGGDKESFGKKRGIEKWDIRYGIAALALKEGLRRLLGLGPLEMWSDFHAQSGKGLDASVHPGAFLDARTSGCVLDLFPALPPPGFRLRVQQGGVC